MWQHPVPIWQILVLICWKFSPHLEAPRPNLATVTGMRCLVSSPATSTGREETGGGPSDQHGTSMGRAETEAADLMGRFVRRRPRSLISHICDLFGAAISQRRFNAAADRPAAAGVLLLGRDGCRLAPPPTADSICRLLPAAVMTPEISERQSIQPTE